MSDTHDLDPYGTWDGDRPMRLGCSCGRHDSAADHDAAAGADDAARVLRARSETAGFEERSRAFIEASLVKALFPQDAVRRRFLKAVGRRTAMAAIGSVLPLASLQAMAQDKAAIEKKDLKIGFIPITCATPLIMAHPLGFYEKQGLNVQVVKTAGWALIRDKMLNKEYDATHFLSPMPLAITMGAGSNATPMHVATIQNTNGQAITLHVKHKGSRDPKTWKGFKFAVPFEYSMHNFLLRYYVAEAGLDPDRDIQIRVVPPPEMVANLRAGNIDGFLGPDPFNQRAVFEEVGFIHLLTKELWDGSSLLRLRHLGRVHPPEPEHLRRAVPLGADRRGDGARGPQPRADRQGDLAAGLPEPARDGGGPGADRPLRRWPGQRAERARTAPTSIRSPGRAWRCGCSRR